MNKQILMICAMGSCLALPMNAQRSTIEKTDNRIELQFNEKPYIILGGELGNSSASSIEDIQRIFPRLKAMGLNTALVPVYWDLTEPEEGTFDFTLLDESIGQARKQDMKLVLLWFGAWKNSMSCYAPMWFKNDCKRFPRAKTRTGKPLEIASAFSQEVLKSDSKAFNKLMTHLKQTDMQNGTVVMVQVENEIGMLEDARDHSAVANEKFNAQVPVQLLSYLKKQKDGVHPVMMKLWSDNGKKMKGSWSEVFGNSLESDEVFMAWHYASYVEKIASAGKEIYNLPMYVNAAMNSRNRRPGEYPSAGPLAHLIDVWHCAAPSIDFLAPDLYDKGFMDWTAQYKLHNNPLFIPEIRLEDNDGVRACYAFGEMDALGFSPFSIEDYDTIQSMPLIQSYNMLTELMPLLGKYKGKESRRGVLLDKERKSVEIEMEKDITLTCSHYFTLPWDPRAKEDKEWPEGGAVVLRLAPREYIVAGSGVVVTFQNGKTKVTQKQELGEDGFVNSGGKQNGAEQKWNGPFRVGIGWVDEVNVDKDGNLKRIRRMNGDQDHQGRHARISVDDFKILHIKLYDYK